MKLYKLLIIATFFVGISYADAEQCINLLQSKDYQKAIDLANKSLRWDKYDFNYNMCAAMSYIALGEPKYAIPYLKNATKKRKHSLSKRSALQLHGC